LRLVGDAVVNKGKIQEKLRNGTENATRKRKKEVKKKGSRTDPSKKPQDCHCDDQKTPKKKCSQNLQGAKSKSARSVAKKTSKKSQEKDYANGRYPALEGPTLQPIPLAFISRHRKMWSTFSKY